MQDSIYTIPVSEVFDPKCGCPICAMRNMLENRCIEYIMGAAMMEPDVRIETNKTGFCKEHFDKMLKARNRLSLALMLESHLAEVREKIMDAKSLNNLLDKSSKAKKVSKINNSCYVCDKIDWRWSACWEPFTGCMKTNEAFEIYLPRRNFCASRIKSYCAHRRQVT